MAISGYEARPVGRQTFTFQPPAPAQSNAAPSGQSRGAEIVGGSFQSGMIAAGPQSDPVDMTSGLGQFFGELMRPHVQRKQQEKFFEGYTAAQSGIALDELTHNDSPLTKIFGPSGFEQGAQFYTAKTKIGEWSEAQLGDMDRLKQMTPHEVAAELAKTSQGMMTGDPYADNIIQSGLLEASGPILNTVAKERFAWQQSEVVRTMTESSTTSANVLQKTLVSQAGLGTPTDEQRSATQAALTQFLSGMAKPHGMTDESYAGYLKTFMRGAMQDGNFYAVEAMRGAGVDRVLPEEDQIKLEDAYLKYGNKALAREAMGVAPDLIALDTRIKTETVSALAAAKELARINGLLRDRTGIDIDLFDYEDIRSTAGSVVDVIVASQRRLEARQFQLQDRAQERQWRLEDDAREEAQATAHSTAAWGVGQVKSAVAAGMKAGDFDILANNEYMAGNYGNMANAYANDGWVSPLVSSRMQAAVTSSLGAEYSKDFHRGYDEWTKLNKVRPAAAAAYYGKYHVPMQKYDAMVRSGASPQIAYARSFGDPATYSVVAIAPDRRKELAAAIPSAVTLSASEWWRFGGIGIRRFGARPDLNTSGLAATVGALSDAVAIAANNTDRPTQSIVDEQLEVLGRNGSLERIGAFAWRQKPGTIPLSSYTKMQPEDLDHVFTAVVDRKLKAVGYRKGASGDNYDILRISTPDGKPALYVDPQGAGLGAQGEIPGVIITAQELVDAKTTELRQRPVPARHSGGIDDLRARGFDPNRPNSIPANWRSYPIKQRTAQPGTRRKSK